MSFLFLSSSILFYSFPSLLSLLSLCCSAVGWDPLSILSLCWSAVRLSLDIQPNRILLVTIHHMLYPITVEVLHQVFSPHGFVEKIVTFQKSAGQHLRIFSSLSFLIWYWLRCVKNIISKCGVTLMRNTSIWIICNSLLLWGIDIQNSVVLLLMLFLCCIWAWYLFFPTLWKHYRVLTFSYVAVPDTPMWKLCRFSSSNTVSITSKCYFGKELSSGILSIKLLGFTLFVLRHRLCLAAGTKYIWWLLSAGHPVFKVSWHKDYSSIYICNSLFCIYHFSFMQPWWIASELQ